MLGITYSCINMPKTVLGDSYIVLHQLSTQHACPSTATLLIVSLAADMMLTSLLVRTTSDALPIGCSTAIQCNLQLAAVPQAGCGADD